MSFSNKLINQLVERACSANGLARFQTVMEPNVCLAHKHIVPLACKGSQIVEISALTAQMAKSKILVMTSNVSFHHLVKVLIRSNLKSTKKGVELALPANNHSKLQILKEPSALTGHR